MSEGTQHLVLYDGPCGFCNWAMRFVMKRDRLGRMRFAPLQGETAKGVVGEVSQEPGALDTMVVVVDWQGAGERRLEWSDAALFLFSQLCWPWRVLWSLRLLPRWFRDWGYRLVARVRYRLAGRGGSCPLPPMEYRERMLP